MPKTDYSRSQLPAARNSASGVIGLWGKLFHRDPLEYDAKLHDRDMTIITARLMRLSERQLNRLGMSHATLALDVEDLALRAEREAQITSDVLALVEDDAPAHSRAIAAE